MERAVVVMVAVMERAAVVMVAVMADDMAVVIAREFIMGKNQVSTTTEGRRCDAPTKFKICQRTDCIIDKKI